MRLDLKDSYQAQKQANIRITPRDFVILLSIAQNQFLTTSQINILHFPSVHRTRKRLRQLYENKYIDRLRIPSGLETLPSESVHTITKAGLRLLRLHGAIHDDVTIQKISRRPGNLLFLSHTLMRNSFRIALEISTRNAPQTSLNNWRHDNSITKYVLMLDSKSQSLRRVPLKADANFSLERDGLGIEYYLEVDNGTMTVSRLVDKMEGYHKWHISSRHPSTKTIIRRNILILVFSKRRAKHITEKLMRLARAKMVSNFWLVAYVERNELILSDLLANPSWSQPTQFGLRQVTFDQQLSNFAPRQETKRQLYL